MNFQAQTASKSPPTRVTSPEVQVLHQRLGQRPLTSRRLTIHAGFARPSLLTHNLHHKSSTAVPTVSSLQAGSNSPASEVRRASSGSAQKLSKMAARDVSVSATDLLKQAMMHRYVLTLTISNYVIHVQVLGVRPKSIYRCRRIMRFISDCSFCVECRQSSSINIHDTKTELLYHSCSIVA